LLTEENQQRSRKDPPFNLLDTGIFEENRYWDVEVTYAKENTEVIFARIRIVNRGPEKATLHLLPNLWFRNTWSWDKLDEPKPLLKVAKSGKAAWGVQAEHPSLGSYYLYGRQEATGLFTDNETNLQRLFNTANASPYVKDGFHQLLINGENML